VESCLIVLVLSLLGSQDIGFLSKMIEELEARNITTVTVGNDSGE
jgi:hypothetical protein